LEKLLYKEVPTSATRLRVFREECFDVAAHHHDYTLDINPEMQWDAKKRKAYFTTSRQL